jgi:hypothetical protein
VLIGIALIFSVGHHIDHIIRGNHVGFPITTDINPFTYSLGFYPVIFLGLFLFYKNKIGPLFWSILTGVGILFVGLTHFGPFALEPPHDIIAPYHSKIFGGLAILWLVLFLLLLVYICIFCLRIYQKQLKEKHPQHKINKHFDL